ncbi:NnrU family protein [Ramlibacter ginsenosidimutans]|uniref:NnrU family protein n=1 Tax=Ramlibacter ginsenosidimutans TaxID=502333 RepID=A0A934TR55_9BURK|nr:NnrU family protein [Ramlibacter ginsenosidimutans]MBK6005590.1 NnrU family protein [Ramlibacter ginsenosidimutans]
MLLLLLGLVLFLGAHSVRIVADGWRASTIAAIGEKPWKGAYSLVSIAGFVLIVVGFSLARQQGPHLLWPAPSVWTRHLAALLTLFAFILVAAAYVPGNAIKLAVRDPMVLGVAVWAFAHLLANNTEVDVLLFGAFLAWAVTDYVAAQKRRRTEGSTSAQPTAAVPKSVSGTKTVATIVVGAVAWAVFAFWLHGWWIGVRPFG